MSNSKRSSRLRTRVATPLAAAVLLLVGCRKNQASETFAADSAATRIAWASRTPCERGLLTEADVGGILRDPIVGARALSGDPESCDFTTTGKPQIEVAVRPGKGKLTVSAWLENRMALQAAPLLGVGDRAVWQRDLHEVIAEKHDLLCDISALGASSDFIDARSDALASRMGALCNKIFAAIP